MARLAPTRCGVLSLAALLLLGCGGPGDGDAATGDDAGTSIDAATSDAATSDAATGSDAAAADAAAADAATPPCGTTPGPDLGSAVQLSRGLVVGRDGTIYFTQVAGVGRRLPDGTLETDWSTLASGLTLAGLALDAANTSLFVAAPDFSGGGAASIYRIDTTSGVATPIVMGRAPFALTVHPDGMLYFGDALTDHVFRVATSGGTPTQVTTSSLPSPRGVAFEASGTLLVASASPGFIFRITLSTAGTETMRQMIAPMPTPGSIALDAMGRIYVTSEFGGTLTRMAADGGGSETLASGLSTPFELDFGRGALSPCEIYFVASGSVTRFENDTPGSATLWH